MKKILVVIASLFAASLIQGEVTNIATRPGSPKGSVQFNSRDQFKGDATFSFSTTTKHVSVNGIMFPNGTILSSSPTIFGYNSFVAGGTNNGVLFVNGTNRLENSPRFIYRENGSLSPYLEVLDGGNTVFRIDPFTGSYIIGDASGLANGNSIIIEDSGNQFIFQNNNLNGRIDMVAATSGAGPAYYNFVDTATFKAIRYLDGTVSTTAVTGGGGGSGITVYPATSTVLARQGVISTTGTYQTGIFISSDTVQYDAANLLTIPTLNAYFVGTALASPAKVFSVGNCIGTDFEDCAEKYHMSVQDVQSGSTGEAFLGGVYDQDDGLIIAYRGDPTIIGATGNAVLVDRLKANKTLSYGITITSMSITVPDTASTILAIATGPLTLTLPAVDDYFGAGGYYVPIRENMYHRICKIDASTNTVAIVGTSTNTVPSLSADGECADFQAVFNAKTGLGSLSYWKNTGRLFGSTQTFSGMGGGGGVTVYPATATIFANQGILNQNGSWEINNNGDISADYGNFTVTNSGEVNATLLHTSGAVEGATAGFGTGNTELTIDADGNVATQGNVTAQGDLSANDIYFTGDFNPVYISPTGSDALDGRTEGNAVQTGTRAVAIGGANFTLVMSSGNYNSTARIDLSTVKNIKIRKDDPLSTVSVFMGEAVTSFTQYDAVNYPKIWYATIVSSIPVTQPGAADAKYIHERGTREGTVSTSFLSNEEHPLLNGRTWRLDNYRLRISTGINAVNLANGKWWFDGGTKRLYISKSDGGNPNGTTYYVPNMLSTMSFVYNATFGGTDSVEIEGVRSLYGYYGFDLTGVRKFKLINTTGEGNYGQGHLALLNHYGEFIYPKSLANGDDGISYDGSTLPETSEYLTMGSLSIGNGDEGDSCHNNSHVTMQGGYMYANYSGGLTPALGCRMDAYDVVTSTNAVGLAPTIVGSRGKTVLNAYNWTSVGDRFAAYNSGGAILNVYNAKTMGNQSIIFANEVGGPINVFGHQDYGTVASIKGGTGFAETTISTGTLYTPLKINQSGSVATGIPAIEISGNSAVTNQILYYSNALTNFILRYGTSAQIQMLSSRSLDLYAGVGGSIVFGTDNVTRAIIDPTSGTLNVYGGEIVLNNSSGSAREAVLSSTGTSYFSGGNLTVGKGESQSVGKLGVFSTVFSTPTLVVTATTSQTSPLADFRSASQVSLSSVSVLGEYYGAAVKVSSVVVSGSGNLMKLKDPTIADGVGTHFLYRADPLNGALAALYIEPESDNHQINIGNISGNKPYAIGLAVNNNIALQFGSGASWGMYSQSGTNFSIGVNGSYFWSANYGTSGSLPTNLFQNVASAGGITLGARAVASQTGNLQEWQDVSGNAVSSMSVTGNFYGTSINVSTAVFASSMTLSGNRLMWNTNPSDGHVIKWSAANNRWEPGSVVTSTAAFGILYTSSAGLNITNISTQPTLAAIFTTSGEVSFSSASTALDRITVSTPGVYSLYAIVETTGSNVTGAANVVYGFEIRVNGVNTGFTYHDYGNPRCDIVGIKTLAAGDYVELYHYVDVNGANANYLLTDAQLKVTSIGGPAGPAGPSGGVTVYPASSTIIVQGHVEISSTTPAISGCGTSPSIAGNDVAGMITVGTGGVATSCTVTFAGPWTNAPSCWAFHEGAILYVRPVTTTSTLVIDASTPFTASGKIKYGCLGYK